MLNKFVIPYTFQKAVGIVGGLSLTLPFKGVQFRMIFKTTFFINRIEIDLYSETAPAKNPFYGITLITRKAAVQYGLDARQFKFFKTSKQF